MSARRAARALATGPRDQGAMPRLLHSGRCIEIWSQGTGPAYQSTRRRYDLARRWWFDVSGTTEIAHQCALLPFGSIWSIEYAMANDSARTLKRLKRAGVRYPHGLEAARSEADELVGLALGKSVSLQAQVEAKKRSNS